MSAALERVQLKHPEGKRAPSIEKRHYALVRKLVLEPLPSRGPGMTWVEMRAAVDKKLKDKLEGANNWWSIHAVKLHLEAIGEVKRVSQTPQRLVRS